MNKDDYQTSLRSMTFIFYRGQQEYQSYIDLQQFYRENKDIQIDFQYHSESLANQHQLTKRQQDRIITYIRKNGGVLQTPNLNYLYDFYTVETSRNFQIQLLSTLILKYVFEDSEVTKHADQVQGYYSILNDEINLKTLQLAEISTKIIIRDNQSFLYGDQYKLGNHYQGEFSSYALVVCRLDNEVNLALVQLREDGKLLPGVQEKWLGQSLQRYQNYLIKFDGLKVIKHKKVNIEDIELWMTYFKIQDAQLSLRELLKSCDLAQKYCSMRRQFKTQDNQQERPILTYQVTAERIINSLALGSLYYICAQDLKQEYLTDLINKKSRKSLNKIFADYFSTYVMQICIKNIEIVRETMGGFGFLRFSGLPTIQEKILWIAQQHQHKRDDQLKTYLGEILNFEKNKQFVAHYIGQFAIQDPKVMFDQLGPIDNQNVQNPFHIFGYHAAKIAERLQNKELQKHNYTAYQLGQLTFELYVSQKFFSIIAFRRYRTSNYILDRLLMIQNFQALSLMETNKEHLLIFRQQVRKVLEQLLPHLEITLDSFEFVHPAALVGQDDEVDFYKKLLDLSKQNLRNNQSDYVREPLRQFLNRPLL
ncbi:hypothetical protein pb186bvf_010850 [Paramecium bursaria]